MTIQQPGSPLTTAYIPGESSNQPLRAPVELGANPKGMSNDEQRSLLQQPLLDIIRMPDRWLLQEYQQVLQSFSAASEDWDNTADDE